MDRCVNAPTSASPCLSLTVCLSSSSVHYTPQLKVIDLLMVTDPMVLTSEAKDRLGKLQVVLGLSEATAKDLLLGEVRDVVGLMMTITKKLSKKQILSQIRRSPSLLRFLFWSDWSAFVVLFASLFLTLELVLPANIHQVMPVYEYDISDIMAELVNDFDNTNSAVH